MNQNPRASRMKIRIYFCTDPYALLLHHLSYLSDGFRVCKSGTPPVVNRKWHPCVDEAGKILRPGSRHSVQAQ
ncbi:hypothetical protein SBV1_1140011 [Verrucomicrobia bacterium]|nr:hypothetical protein SBV1_1140011 [Verrucomicrobiota bacterium]